MLTQRISEGKYCCGNQCEVAQRCKHEITLEYVFIVSLLGNFQSFPQQCFNVAAMRLKPVAAMNALSSNQLDARKLM